MNQTKIPAIKAITVSVCICILLSMSAYAEAAGAHNNPKQSGREREKTETAECAESHSALTLSDGDLRGLDLNGHQLYINGVLYGE